MTKHFNNQELPHLQAIGETEPQEFNCKLLLDSEKQIKVENPKILTFNDYKAVEPKELKEEVRKIPINSENWEDSYKFTTKFVKLATFKEDTEENRPQTRVGRTRGTFRVSKRKK